MKASVRLLLLAGCMVTGLCLYGAAQQGPGDAASPSSSDTEARAEFIDRGNDAMFAGDYLTGEKFFRQALAYSEQHNMGAVHVGNAHNALGWSLEMQRRYADAETEYRTALQNFQGILLDSDVLVLRSKLGLGTVLTGLGRYQEAEPLLLASLHGEEADPEITACELSYPLDALTNLYDASHQYSKGESVYTEVFALMTGKRGTPCEHFVAVLDHLAQLYADDNQWDVLEKIQRGRAGLVLGMKGPNSEEYGDAIAAIAQSLGKRRNWDEAAKTYAQAADVYRHTDPPAWSKLAGSLSQEELAFNMAGKPEEAKKVHAATLAAEKEANAGDPRGEMRSLQSQVTDAENNGDLDQAAQLVAREVQASRWLTPNDQMLALDDSARVHELRKELPQAEAELKQVLAMSIATTGPSSLSTANAHFSLAWFYQKDNSRLADAEASYTAALALYGPGDTDKIKTSLSMLGYAYLKEGKFGQAEPVYQRLFKLAEQMHDGSTICLVLLNQAQLFQKTNRVPQAEQALQRALQLTERLPEPLNHQWAAAAMTAAAFYQQTGRPQQAEQLYTQTIAFIEKEVSPNSASLRLPMDKLIALLKSQGRLSEAAQYEAREEKFPPMPAWPGSSN
jgi:hypothetical protein